MKKLFIVGGDGFAREVHMHMMRHTAYGVDFEFGGFLGHSGYGESVDYRHLQKDYKGDLEAYSFGKDDFCLIGMGYPGQREIVFNDIKRVGARLANFISSDSMVADDVELGEGNIIISSFLSVGVKMGSGNLLNGNVAIGHDASLGDFNFFGPYSQLVGEVRMGHKNQLGISSVVLPNVKVGDCNKIAPLSAVYKGCKSNAYYLGNPAVKVGNID